MRINIKQWINFNLHIGFDKILIYDNANIEDNLSYCSIETQYLPNLLKDYIDNGKSNINKMALFKEYRKMGNPNGQTTQQCHSIHSFKHSKLIGLFDIDEYINMKTHTNIKIFLRLYTKI